MRVPSGEEAVASRSVVSRSRTVPPVAAQAVLSAFDPPRVQWHSPDGIEIVGVGAAAHLNADAPNRFQQVREQGAALLTGTDHNGPPITRPRFYGGVAFSDDHTPNPPWTGFDGATFLLPRVQVTNDGDSTWVTVSHVGSDPQPGTVSQRLDTVVDRIQELPEFESGGDRPGIDTLDGTPDRAGWETQVETVVDSIDAGTVRKVVLARALRATLETDLDVPQVLARLRHRYADCYRFLIEPPDGTAFFGAPPERFLRMSGRTVETEALAGSVERGDTPAADAKLGAQLRESPKLQEEQSLVVEAIENQLAPVGSVTVGDQTVRRLSNIQHLQTPISASLDSDYHVLDVVELLHPTPAVGGVPPDTALETIRRTEPFDRGWYAAPVGWFDSNGDGEFAVAIRSAVGADRSVTLYAGNGIVADSDPREEWSELRAKYEPLLAELR